MIPRPRHIEEATDGAILRRRASDYLRGVRAIQLDALAALLRAFPSIDARWLVLTLDERVKARRTP